MKLLIVYHSQSGTTSKMAEAVIAGASDPAVEGVELRVREALGDIRDRRHCALGLIEDRDDVRSR